MLTVTSDTGYLPVAYANTSYAELLLVPDLPASRYTRLDFEAVLLSQQDGAKVQELADNLVETNRRNLAAATARMLANDRDEALEREHAEINRKKAIDLNPNRNMTDVSDEEYVDTNRGVIPGMLGWDYVRRNQSSVINGTDSNNATTTTAAPLTGEEEASILLSNSAMVSPIFVSDRFRGERIVDNAMSWGSLIYTDNNPICAKLGGTVLFGVDRNFHLVLKNDNAEEILSTVGTLEESDYSLFGAEVAAENAAAKAVAEAAAAAALAVQNQGFGGVQNQEDEEAKTTTQAATVHKYLPTSATAIMTNQPIRKFRIYITDDEFQYLKLVGQTNPSISKESNGFSFFNTWSNDGYYSHVAIVVETAAGMHSIVHTAKAFDLGRVMFKLSTIVGKKNGTTT